MTMKVVVDTSVLEALPDRTEATVSAFLDAESEQTVNDIKLSIQEVSIGRMYGGHIASRPGDAPNIDEGVLINSYTWKHKGSHTRVIMSDDEKAPWLEMGTENMLPRPHVGPALERLRERLPRDAKRFRLVK